MSRLHIPDPAADLARRMARLAGGFTAALVFLILILFLFWLLPMFEGALTRALPV